MKKTRYMSVLLSLSLFCTTLLPSTSVYADNGSDSDSGMVINKTARANTDGTYTIQLEAYATGNKVITEQTKDIATDIVLVLDQSGSMKEPIGSLKFSAYERNDRKNSNLYEKRHNGGEGNLWYPLGDGKYASVSVQRKPVYVAQDNKDNDWYYNNRNNLYIFLDNQYKKVTVSRRGISSERRRYTYNVNDSETIATSTGDNSEPNFGGYAPIYLLDDSKTQYSYSYTPATGVPVQCGTSIGADTRFDVPLYKKEVISSGGVARTAALKTAVQNFSNEVAEKAKGEDNLVGTADDVNHRIAVVGYANQDPDYQNTEVFVGERGYNYPAAAQAMYASAFQNMNTEVGENNIQASIGALSAEGPTYTQFGLEMANGILEKNPVHGGEKRNRVIILFTDGYPGFNQDDFDRDAVDAALAHAQTAKTKGVSLYAVGIFAGADATSAGNENSSNNADKANWFMQNVSSNGGAPRTPSYYLSAGDAETLNDIFQQISQQIEEGGAGTTLSSETVIKDIISPAFTLPEGTTAGDIRLKTYSCTGKDGDAYTWSENSDKMGETASVNGDQISVTGFDFAENYVGTVTQGENVIYRGHKLEISFTVCPRKGFLGGNKVYTNTDAGVYENNEAEKPVLTFERPQVNVPISSVTVTAEDKDVYLSCGLTAAQLREGATVKVGDVVLDLSKAEDGVAPYGLEPWQTEYVNISVTVKNAKGEDISADLQNLTDDTTYTVAVTVSPKTDGLGAAGTAAVSKAGEGEGDIRVYKPELTYKDSEVYYGDAVPSDFSANLTSTKWKHGRNEADAEEMGNAPALNMIYTPDSTKLLEGKVNTKQSIGVDAAVKIGAEDVTDKTAFVHTVCTGTCEWKEMTLDGTPAFLLHVKTCTLNIKKNGGNAGEPYVFTVYKDGEKYSEATIVGNETETICELPVGRYTIEEDSGWSWRFTADNGAAADLTATHTEESIVCTNKEVNNFWLNGFSKVVKNIFGVTD